MKQILLSIIAFLCLVLISFGQATLPLDRTGWNSTPAGWTDSGTGSYLSTFACSGSNGGRLDSTGDYYQVYFNSTPNSLSYDLKVSGSTSSNLLVEESSNGTVWTTLINHTAIPTSCTPYNYVLNAATRYVRWTYNKVAQNVTIDDVSITAGSSGPTITVTQATGGTITPGTTSVTFGSNQSFTATPDACYTFSNWIVDGSNAGSANTYTFNNVTTDHTITAVYNINSYNITSSAGIDGTISPNGVTSVNCGSDQTYIFTPESGYVVDDVLVDGVSVGSPSSYTFSNVTSSHTISVTFAVYIGPCLEESFETGMPTAYYTGNQTLSSGQWQFTNVIRGTTGTTTSSYSAQIRSATGSNITTPILTDIVDFITFNVTASTSSGAYQVNISTDGGSTWSPAPGSPFSIGTSTQSMMIDINNPSVNRIQIYRTGATIYIDDFAITCDTTCTPTQSVTSFAPASGPIGTYVTIAGTGFTGSTTVEFNGTSVMNYVSKTTTELVVEVPSGTVTGPISVTETSCPVQTSDFTIIDNNGSCGGVSDLMMTEIYDKASGSLGYIEVFNGTGGTLNLSNYSIRRYGDNADLISGEYTLYTFPSSYPTITNGTVYVGKMFSPGNTDEDASPNFTYDIDCSFTGGNFSCGGFNAEDIFHLYRGSTLIDVYIVPNTNVGYIARRNTNTAGPNNSNNPADWSHNTTENTSNLGIFNYTGAVSNFPSINAHPNDVSDCASEALFTAVASPGNVGTLSYQWYFNDGTATGWTLVNSANLSLTTVSGETSNQLLLTDGFYNYDGYQFYCLVTENGTCSTATNATQLLVTTTTWDGSNWLSGAPDISTIAIIDGDYDTSVGGQQSSFSACQLLVNGGYTLFIEDGDYVEVENNLTANGEIIVRTSGSFKQNNDAGLINGAILSTPSLIKVEKETAPLNAWYEYTYWSSPVANETVGVALGDSNPNRRFWYNAQNYLDTTMETNNDNGTATGQDDIDDDANDWTLATAGMTMSPGVGFGATHSSTGFSTPGNQFKYTFQGPFNNGAYNVPLYRNDAELNDNNWNLIGNPYPSAISADALLAANTVIDMNVPAGVIDGAIFLWSQNVAPDGSTNGNENLNFSQSDYAIINGTGQAAGGDGVTPNRYIASGQAFFVSMSNSAPSTVVSGTIRTADFVFNNSMRVLGNNDQFFRSAQGEVPNKLWVDLTSDNGVFNQILVGYVNGATDANDGMYYDALKNLSTEANAILYSRLNSDYTDLKFGIQGKHPNSLNIDESIPLGFSNFINEATIYKLSLSKLEGDFLLNNDIYVIDHILNAVHNLKQEDYSFVSEVGEFNNRFEIVFQNQALSVVENEITPNDLSIVELNDGTVRFTVSNNLTIESVQIFDLLGRTLYDLKGSNHSETFDLSNLSQTAYIAKVTLSNGQIISKRAVKRK